MSEALVVVTDHVGRDSTRLESFAVAATPTPPPAVVFRPHFRRVVRPDRRVRSGR